MSNVMERPSVDMKAVEMAAQSPDPRVRGVAQRRLEIEREIAPLDGFLSFYCGEAVAIAPIVPIAAAVVAVPVTKKPNPVHVNGASKDAAPKGKTERMIEVAKGIIVASGQPMTLQVLFDRMQRDHPALCLASPDSMRARIAEHKDKLARFDSRGYWPIGMEPPPDADVDADV
jgi:hypothetical protein